MTEPAGAKDNGGTDLVVALRTGRGLTEEPNEDGAVLRDAWVHHVMQLAADEIERLREFEWMYRDLCK